LKAKTKKTKVPATSLILRTVAEDGSSHNGFKWPDSGMVEAPDWKPTKECGNGLHGWLWGCGNWSLKNPAEKIKWLVAEVETASIIDLDGKVKFPKANVVASFAAWSDAMKFIRARHIDDASTTVATGDSGHASATGDSGHASATGDYGHASATGDYGHASATGDSGHASATGDSGHASATGDYGHASATGDYGWAVGGYNSQVKADKNGALTALWFDEKSKRPRVVVGYVGEDGIEANTWYQVKDGKFVKVTTT
jgi:hypothetical protein